MSLFKRKRHLQMTDSASLYAPSQVSDEKTG